MYLADITTDSNALAALVVAITGLVTAIGTLVGIIATHRKVTKVNTTVNAVHDDTQTIVNGGDTHDNPTGSPDGNADISENA